MNETATRTINDTAKGKMNEAAKLKMNETEKNNECERKKRMRTQIPDERLPLNDQLRPGALGPGPMAQNTGK